MPHLLASGQAGSERPPQSLFRVRFLMQLGVGRASRKSGYEHISIFQKTFLPVVWAKEIRCRWKGILSSRDQDERSWTVHSWTNADSLSSSHRGLSLNERKAFKGGVECWDWAKFSFVSTLVCRGNSAFPWLGSGGCFDAQKDQKAGLIRE